MLTFDDGYADHFTYAYPVLEQNGLQGSFFIPGKTFSEHQLLDVNKIHYILATANTQSLFQDVLAKLDEHRGVDFDYPSNEELLDTYAKAERFDGKEIIFIKRMLQTVLPEELRGRIASELFKQYVGIPEETLAYELYLTADQIRTMKRHGMYIGIHGYDHYWLGDLSKQKMQEDITKALEVMDEFIDTDGWAMNYPYGSYNDAVVEYIKA